MVSNAPTSSPTFYRQPPIQNPHFYKKFSTSPIDKEEGYAMSNKYELYNKFILVVGAQFMLKMHLKQPAKYHKSGSKNIEKGHLQKKEKTQKFNEIKDSRYVY